MGGKNGSLAKLAGNQHGVVAVWQLLRLGFTRRQLERRVEGGQLHRLYRGVYAVGHRHVTQEGRCMGAVLACGPDAVLSHWTAAIHWGLLRTPRSVIDVSLVGHRCGGKGVRTHSSDLEVAFLDLCRRYGLPTPIANGAVEGVEVDMHWPGTRLIVEVDTYEYHRTPAEFAADRRKDAHLKTLGYEVLRVAESWLDADPAGVAATIRTLLPT